MRLLSIRVCVIASTIRAGGATRPPIPSKSICAAQVRMRATPRAWKPGGNCLATSPSSVAHALLKTTIYDDRSSDWLGSNSQIGAHPRLHGRRQYLWLATQDPGLTGIAKRVKATIYGNE